MSCFAIAHGAGGSAWEWHLVGPELERLGHEMVAIDLPSENDAATFDDYADQLAGAVAGRTDIVAVGHSLGGFTAPRLAARVELSGIVYVSAMIPAPGEPANEWWSNTGHHVADESDDELRSFFNGVPAALTDEAMRRSRDQSGTPMDDPFPHDLPDVPTRAIAFADDRFFPLDQQARIARDRLGMEIEPTPGGHCGYLSHPAELAELLSRA
ncbi:alpha/beta hydrolase [Thermoleophilia bacterium SCSIO 60948]|nr:alpha/beta hydrolase [Thermoleophilia bacterium SCSIO 60948]